MSDFFFQIVKDAINYDNTDTKADLYKLSLADMRGWCVEQMDLAGVPAGYFRDCVIMDLFAGSSDFPYKLWQYIQDTCWPENHKEN